MFSYMNIKLNKIKSKDWKQPRNRGGRKKYITQNGVNLKNLHKIKCVPQMKNKVNMNMFTVNSRSIQGKYLDI